jgi:hypothetical protein
MFDFTPTDVDSKSYLFCDGIIHQRWQKIGETGCQNKHPGNGTVAGVLGMHTA